MKSTAARGLGLVEVVIGMAVLLIVSFIAINQFTVMTRQLAQRDKYSDLFNVVEQRLTRIRGNVRSALGSTTQFLRTHAAAISTDPTGPVVLMNPPLTRDVSASAFASGVFGFNNPERSLVLDGMSVDIDYRIELVGLAFNGTSMVPFAITATSGHRLSDVSLVRVRATARPSGPVGARELARVFLDREILIAVP